MRTQWGPLLKWVIIISDPAENHRRVAGETVLHGKEKDGALKAGPKGSCRGDGKVG